MMLTNVLQTFTSVKFGKNKKKIIDDFLMKNFNLEEDENGIFFYKGNVKCVENF